MMEPRWGQFHVMICSQFQWDSSTNPFDYNKYRVRPTTQVLDSHSSHISQVHSQSHTAFRSRLASTLCHTQHSSHTRKVHTSHTQLSSHTWQVHSQSHTALQSHLASTLCHTQHSSHTSSIKPHTAGTDPVIWSTNPVTPSTNVAQEKRPATQYQSRHPQ